MREGDRRVRGLSPCPRDLLFMYGGACMFMCVWGVHL